MGAAERKRKQRQQEREQGMVTIDFKVTESAKRRLDSMLEKRGYDLSEYAALLFHCDVSRFEESIKDIGKCEKCGLVKQFDTDCAFQGMADCWETVERKKLTRV